jgi:glycosyltransferase involved in cell wall biosynthesis
VLFWTFRYAPSFFGLPLVQDRAVLVPTAEEDHALRLDVVGEFFRRPVGYLFLTPEEQGFVSVQAGRTLEPSAVIGAGLDPAPAIPGDAVDRALAPLALPASFVLYLGRVDRNKGCDSLLSHFEEYAESRPDAMLVLAGPATLRIPTHPQIRALGYVSDEVREALLQRACVLVVPSPYESLSMVLLEAWNRGTPALVNAQCSVLEGQVRRANGGLHYRSPEEFALALDRLLTDEPTRTAFGRQGLAYVEREYRWPTVVSKVERLLDECRALAARKQAPG